MDKAEFVEQAPLCYALAIAAFITRVGSTISRNSIAKEYFVRLDEDDPDTSLGLLSDDVLWGRAIAWLQARDMIEVTKPPFGPPIYARSEEFSRQWSMLTEGDGLFGIYGKLQDSDNWLFEALRSVYSTGEKLGITEADFDSPDSDWEPIPINQDDPVVKKAVEKLSEAVEEIRKDNGYAATVPEERAYVLQGLSDTLERLKSAAISAPFIRSALERLALVARRFKNASLEAVVSGAKAALVEFAKKHGLKILNDLWSLWP
jgi:hypothetical protein